MIGVRDDQHAERVAQPPFRGVGQEAAVSEGGAGEPADETADERSRDHREQEVLEYDAARSLSPTARREDREACADERLDHVRGREADHHRHREVVRHVERELGDPEREQDAGHVRRGVSNSVATVSPAGGKNEAPAPGAAR